MNYRMHPDRDTVAEYIKNKEPLIIAIPFDYYNGGEILVSLLDDSFEHHILLAHFDINQTWIDRYYRIIVDEDSADWTFVCPQNYNGITDRKKRINAYYDDGFAAISKVMSELGYYSDIKIPKRYRRHFDAMGDDSTFLPY